MAREKEKELTVLKIYQRRKEDFSCETSFLSLTATARVVRAIDGMEEPESMIHLLTHETTKTTVPYHIQVLHGTIAGPNHSTSLKIWGRICKISPKQPRDWPIVGRLGRLGTQKYSNQRIGIRKPSWNSVAFRCHHSFVAN